MLKSIIQSMNLLCSFKSAVSQYLHDYMYSFANISPSNAPVTRNIWDCFIDDQLLQEIWRLFFQNFSQIIVKIYDSKVKYLFM